MNLAQWLHPTPAGLALAALAVVAGAPLFSDGLRALRARRNLARLARLRLADGAEGLGLVSGRVALESPLFAPLSAKPCAGYQLALRAVGLPLQRTLEVRRPFVLVEGGLRAEVADEGAWTLAATAEREVAATEPLSEGLAHLLAQVPEALWWRRSGGTLRLTEHALFAGAEVHVVGHVGRLRRFGAAPEVEVELLRTGTGGVVEVVATLMDDPGEGRTITGGDAEWMHVFGRASDAAALTVPVRRIAGVALGPLLSLLGMVYLASAADYLRALGRF